ncbi:MAG: hypothetical protein FRX49_05765 [Trebouxia sp. A1-2]|nr:MAG: hypothetical protein FRX49_05765 [Trebouxia sp. A1-2]
MPLLGSAAGTATGHGGGAVLVPFWSTLPEVIKAAGKGRAASGGTTAGVPYTGMVQGRSSEQLSCTAQTAPQDS